MAIVKCSECGKDVSNKAETCIYCGGPISDKKSPKPLDKSRETVKAIAVFACLAVFFVIISGGSDDDNSESVSVNEEESNTIMASDQSNVESESVNLIEPDADASSVTLETPEDPADPVTTEKVLCETFDCMVDKAMYIAPTACKPHIEKLSKYDFEWTDKWYETVFTNYMAVDGKPDQAYLIGDKLKFQNGFGAWANMIYICTYDLKADSVVDVGVEQGRL